MNSDDRDKLIEKMEKKMSKKLYLVETISMFRMRYVVKAKDAIDAENEIVMNLGNTDFKEFSQVHLDEIISSSREISKVEYLDLFDKENDYLSNWSEEQKMNFINKVDYKK